MVTTLVSALAAFMALGVSVFPVVNAEYDISTRQAAIDSSRTLAYDLMTIYKGNQSGQIPGLLPGPPSSRTTEGVYWWWQGGALMGTMVDYYHYTGDDTYNHVVTEGLLWQAGPNNDYMPPNATAELSNDDQCQWAISAMLAAENGFPNPPKGSAQWLDLANAVYQSQVRRWDQEEKSDVCGGGLRWQVPPTNVGYDYKNSASTGCFFNLASRLARYTGNATYAASAEKAWDWLVAVKLVDATTGAVADGARTSTNCSTVNTAQFSLNAGYILEGSAFLYNYTNGTETWKDRTNTLATAILKTFFKGEVAYEVACEPKHEMCTSDMLMYKGFLHRWLAVVSQLMPTLEATFSSMLQKSAAAAVAQCTGGKSGRECGFYWTEGKYVSTGGTASSGAGEQMDVLAAVLSTLVGGVSAPATANSATGTVSGNPAAGNGTTTTGGGGNATSTAPPSSTSSSAAVYMGASGVLMSALVGLGALAVAA
ncbi:putative glycosyl hydrolase [Podospora appendiculata]|uniref:Mannan endo-1,6-alpha-mannosidase n=1 Tax=Podospora appendiculata TaxID=314037 RepID=A0AAE1CD69_9PEZI|nr:putative glycosyl hydrolase [Podospora appendiculata]